MLTYILQVLTVFFREKKCHLDEPSKNQNSLIFRR